MDIKDRIRGSLIGGAAGDALGYPVEFMSLNEIKIKYGKSGITEYKLTNGKALISDDTQMTLFTTNGLIYAMSRLAYRGILGPIEDYIYNAYLNWYYIQNDLEIEEFRKISWLCDVSELSKNRAPGNTCMSALGSGKKGTREKPINNSMGCGGIMRVSPIGLYKAFKPDNAFTVASKAAAITHGNRMGYLPAGALAYIINSIVYDNVDLKSSILKCIDYMRMNFDFDEAKDICLWMNKAIELSGMNTDIENIKEYDHYDHCGDTGGGWTGASALYISLYSAIKYEHEFDQAIICAVNHSGDSDSTGAITGNIVGAINGFDSISEKWKNNLELYDVIMEIADDLYKGEPTNPYGFAEDDIDWEKKYVEATRVQH